MNKNEPPARGDRDFLFKLELALSNLGVLRISRVRILDALRRIGFQ